MNWRIFSTIWVKELKDAVRDRRTLLSMVVMPLLLMPALFLGIVKFTEYQNQQQSDKTVVYAIEPNQDQNPVVLALKKQPKTMVKTETGDLSALVAQGKVDAALIFPSAMIGHLEQQQPVTVTLLEKSLQDTTGHIAEHVTVAVAGLNKELIAHRLAVANVPLSTLTGVTTSITDVSSAQEKTGFGLGLLLPLFLVMWSLIGGQYIAIDVSAGEKERKTLEALLLTPASRLSVVMGKFLAVATVALVSVVVAMASLFVSFKYLISSLIGQGGEAGKAFSEFDVSSALRFNSLGLILMVSILLILLFSALLISVGIFAKSYREAQSYISPLYIAAIVPVAMLNSVPNLEVQNAFFLIPAVNAVLLFKEVLKGVYDPTHIGLTVVSLLIAAAIALVVATRIFQQERVLFKQ